MKTRMIALLLIMLFAVVLFSYRLQQWPTSWYDEGIHLQVSKNLALSGRYGIQSSEGFRDFDPLVTTGPTVTVPIAVVFGLAGVSLLWARAVIVIYALLTVLVYFLVVEKLFKLNTAVVATLLLISLSASFDDISGSFLALSRMDMGEVPAIFWMLAGSLLWYRHQEKRGYLALTGAGLCFGLAMITKPQYLLVFGALVIIYLIDRLWYRQLRLRQVAIPIIVGLTITMIWYFYQSFQTAANQAGQAVILDRFGAQISLFSFSLIIRSVRVLLSSGVLIWGLPGLVYGLYKSRERNILGIQRGFLLTFCFLWFFWFIFGSISWLRYAFPAISIMILFIAKLLVDLADDFIFTRWRRRSADGTHIDQSRLVKSLAVTVAIALMVFVPLEVRLKDILTPSATSPTDFSVYLQQNVPKDAVIESFEPEVVFLSDHNFHQPTLAVQDAAVRFVRMSQPYPPNFYSMESVNSEYLVLGPYGRTTRLYADWLKSGQYSHVASIGGYDLFKLNDE